mmetsp:Transcript_22482/g.33978  ORF Transcript_22482/g.33978 Transcript_22482/m.33978 type:complete len:93 (+) Transcript_22482:767-1045(+)
MRCLNRGNMIPAQSHVLRLSHSPYSLIATKRALQHRCLEAHNGAVPRPGIREKSTKIAAEFQRKVGKLSSERFQTMERWAKTSHLGMFPLLK